MAKGHQGAVRHIRAIFDGGTVAGLTDGQLLERFNALGGEGVEPAFAALVGRHGPMVLRVCRGVLGDRHDAEDAFQATFLILARKAGSLWVRDSLAPWLYQVAHRTASCARSAAARRRRAEREAAETAEPSAGDERPDDLGVVLLEEVHRLPARYRAAIVAFYLEGLTKEQAAQQLGWPVGTVQSRLARGREQLRRRLTRRGLAPTDGALIAALSLDARSAVPEALAESALRSAQAITTGQATAGVVSASVLTLMEGVLTAMSMIKLKVIITALLLLGAGAGVLAFQDRRTDEASNKGVNTEGESAPRAPDIGPRNRRAANPVEKTVTIFDRSRDARNGRDPNADPFNAVLNKPIPIQFPDETPLEDVLKHIKAASVGPNLPNGIPIYVDPVGLQEAEKTTQSPVQLDLEGVPLRTSLTLLLKQLGLVYEVIDGELMIITAPGNEGTFGVGTPEELTPLEEMQRKADRGELSLEEMQRLVEQLKIIGELRKIGVEIDGMPHMKFLREPAGSVHR